MGLHKLMVDTGVTVEQLAPELAELLHTVDTGVMVLVTPAEEATADMAKLHLAVEEAGGVTDQHAIIRLRHHRTAQCFLTGNENLFFRLYTKASKSGEYTWFHYQRG